MDEKQWGEYQKEVRKMLGKYNFIDKRLNINFNNYSGIPIELKTSKEIAEVVSPVKEAV